MLQSLFLYLNHLALEDPVKSTNKDFILQTSLKNVTLEKEKSYSVSYLR